MHYSSDTAGRDRTGLVGGLTFLFAVGIPTAAILTAGMREVEVEPGLIDWIFVGGVAVVTILTFGGLTVWLSRKQDARTTPVGLVFSILAVLTVPVAFWTMLPVILGSAGAWLGYRAIGSNRAAGQPVKAATTAVVLGALAALTSVAMYIATS